MRSMLEQNELTQLRHMYRLLRRVSGGVNLMAECFNKFLREDTLKNLSQLDETKQPGGVQRSKPRARGIAFVPVSKITITPKSVSIEPPSNMLSWLQGRRSNAVCVLKSHSYQSPFYFNFKLYSNFC